MRKDHLTKYEQETIYLTSRGDDTVSIYTYEPELKRRMAAYAAKYPEYAEMEFQNDWGGASYKFKKKKMPLSELLEQCSISEATFYRKLREMRAADSAANQKKRIN